MVCASIPVCSARLLLVTGTLLVTACVRQCKQQRPQAAQRAGRRSEASASWNIVTSTRGVPAPLVLVVTAANNSHVPSHMQPARGGELGGVDMSESANEGLYGNYEGDGGGGPVAPLAAANMGNGTVTGKMTRDEANAHTAEMKAQLDAMRSAVRI
jgi:hypothetical protein